MTATTQRVTRRWACRGALILLATAALGADVRIEGDFRIGPLRSIAISGDPVMSTAGIVARFAALIPSSKPRPPIVILWGYPSHDAFLAYQVGPPPLDTPFERTLEALRRSRASDPRSAIRLIAIGPNVVVQQVNGGRISRTVVAGFDPALATVGGTRFELAALSFGQRPRPLGPNDPNPPFLTANVLASRRPTTGLALRYTRSLMAATHAAEVSLNIRTDTWFLNSAPLWYPFAPEAPAPTQEQYYKNAGWYCFGNRSTLRCR